MPRPQGLWLPNRVGPGPEWKPGNMDIFWDFLKVLFIGVAIASPLLILDVFVRLFPFGVTKKDN